MARHLRLRHREAHVGEEPPLPALADVPLGVVVGLGRGRSDDVEPELEGELIQLRRVHARILPRARSGLRTIEA